MAEITLDGQPVGTVTGEMTIEVDVKVPMILQRLDLSVSMDPATGVVTVPEIGPDPVPTRRDIVRELREAGLWP